MGRIGTVKLLVEKYGVDVNHVSHKLFCTPLGKCTIASANPLPDGLEVVEYLCRRPELDMGLANGEYCNDDTALAYVIQQGQEEIVRLLLKHGGPVDDVSAELHEQCEGVESEEKVRVHVLSRHDEYRKPVRLAMKHEKGSAEGSAEVPRERFT